MGRAAQFSQKYPQPRVGKKPADPPPPAVQPSEFHFKPKNDTQHLVKELWPSKRLIILIGDRGTGKSACALGMGLSDVIADPIRTRKVIVTRPTVAVDERLGFFSGSLEEKLGPWFAAVGDVLDSFGVEGQHRLMAKVEPVALGMLEGRTFTNCVFVADELQHATADQLDVAMTRIGRNCKGVFCGSPTVKNSPFLKFAKDLAPSKNVAVIHCQPADQMRDEFLTELMALRAGSRR